MYRLQLKRTCMHEQTFSSVFYLYFKRRTLIPGIDRTAYAYKFLHRCSQHEPKSNPPNRNSDPTIHGEHFFLSEVMSDSYTLTTTRMLHESMYQQSMTRTSLRPNQRTMAGSPRMLGSYLDLIVRPNSFIQYSKHCISTPTPETPAQKPQPSNMPSATNGTKPSSFYLPSVDISPYLEDPTSAAAQNVINDIRSACLPQASSNSSAMASPNPSKPPSSKPPRNSSLSPSTRSSPLTRRKTQATALRHHGLTIL